MSPTSMDDQMEVVTRGGNSVWVPTELVVDPDFDIAAYLARHDLREALDAIELETD